MELWDDQLITIGTDMDRRGHDLIVGTNLAFTWRGWGKSWEISVGV